ncbi:MAG: hypothetical protein EAZ32_08320 [Cytophagia bacterium]|nr:MAG: hypothetical protein EAZ46_03880 [Runella sp.]TAG20802.1 MAG: hypothetical protein EAZ38_09410 [Cytophagales bacterium]TAG39921.1 MAG: hypothetical protein EAZ32_08320 [Cytophagia bacterium]TAG81607.1 MAG: hypothetical protein EAZ22_06840 [Cytophagales bacterium]
MVMLTLTNDLINSSISVMALTVVLRHVEQLYTNGSLPMYFNITHIFCPINSAIPNILFYFCNIVAKIEIIEK